MQVIILPQEWEKEFRETSVRMMWHIRVLIFWYIYIKFEINQQQWREKIIILTYVMRSLNKCIEFTCHKFFTEYFEGQERGEK